MELIAHTVRPHHIATVPHVRSAGRLLQRLITAMIGHRVEVVRHRVVHTVELTAAPVQFAEVVRMSGIKTIRMVKDLVYLLNVQLVPTMSQASEK